jgi:hypothetical protein
LNHIAAASATRPEDAEGPSCAAAYFFVAIDKLLLESNGRPKPEYLKEDNAARATGTSWGQKNSHACRTVPVRKKS